MIEAATPMKPKKGAEEGQRSETAASNTVESIVNDMDSVMKWNTKRRKRETGNRRGKMRTG